MFSEPGPEDIAAIEIHSIRSPLVFSCGSSMKRGGMLKPQIELDQPLSRPISCSTLADRFAVAWSFILFISSPRFEFRRARNQPHLPLRKVSETEKKIYPPEDQYNFNNNSGKLLIKHGDVSDIS